VRCASAALPLPLDRPDRILISALLPERAALGAEGGGLVPEGALSRLPGWRSGWGIRRHSGRSAGRGDECLHRLCVWVLRGSEDLPRIGWFGAVVAWAFHH
jgi:hypothetical protein